MLSRTVVCLSRLPRVLFSVFCSPFSGAQSAPSLHPRHVCDVPTSTRSEDTGAPPTGRRVRTLGDRQGANRRAAVAVSGGAAERPMEPKGFAPPFASLREISQTATGTPQQEMQEIQERPDGRRVRGRAIWSSTCPSRACRAFRSLWPWKVCRFAPARSVLRGGISRPSTEC